MAETVRDLLRRAVEDLPEPVLVPTSAGVDSTAVLLVLLDLGREVVATSFTLQDRESRDFRAARENAAALGVRFVPTILPIGTDAIARDVRGLVRDGCRRKTSIECVWPFLYVLALGFDVGAASLATGSAADGLYGVSKRAMLHFRYPVETFDAFRRTYFADPDRAQTATVARIAVRYGIAAAAPWRDPTIVGHYLGRTWDEMNRPRQKEPTRAAFPELDRLRIYPHTNLQLGDSGIAEAVGAAALATWGHRDDRSPVAAYNRAIREDSGLWA